MNPLISVCIPNYNCEKFIEKMVSTIQNQTYSNLDILIGDNTSTDQSIAIIQALQAKDQRIRYYQNLQNIGFARNCNRLIEEAKGEYVAIYHSDDMYDKTIIEKQKQFLDQHPEVAAVFTRHVLIDPTDKVIKSAEKCGTDYIIFDQTGYLDSFICDDKNIIVCPTGMFRRSVLLDLKGFDLEIKYIEDVELWVRILENHKIGILNEPLFKYRVHFNQGSQVYKQLDRESLHFSIPYLQEYFKKSPDLQARYQEPMKKMIADDYLELAKNQIILKNKAKLIEYIRVSKKYFIFPFPSKQWLTQHSKWVFIRFFMRLQMLKNRGMI